jgi:hypothetical protein
LDKWKEVLTKIGKELAVEAAKLIGNKIVQAANEMQNKEMQKRWSVDRTEKTEYNPGIYRSFGVNEESGKKYTDFKKIEKKEE